MSVWREFVEADHSESKADFAHLLAEWLADNPDDGAKEKRLDRALERTHREIGRVFLQNKTRNNVFIDKDFVHD